MPWISVAAPIAGAVIGNMLGGGGGPTAGGVSPTAQLPGQPQMGADLQSAVQGYMPQAQQYYGAVNPNYANQAFQAMYYNPYAQGVQAAAGQAGQMAGQFAPMAQQAGVGQFGAGQQALGAGQQIWQTAQDPQQALYSRMQQQTLDKANALNSMYGLGASGAGAGMAQQALTNLDINWQNQQLGRQLQGMQGLQAGIGAAGQAAQQGVGMGQAGMGFQQQAGALPYEAANALAQGQFGAIGQAQAAMQGGMQPWQQNINNMLAYTGAGQAAQAQANQQAYQQQLLAQQNAANVAQLGTNVAYSGLKAYYGGSPNTYAGMSAGMGAGMGAGMA